MIVGSATTCFLIQVLERYWRVQHQQEVWETVTYPRAIQGVNEMIFDPVVKNNPAIAQLAEHLTVDCCSNQMVPGSIPGGRSFKYCNYGREL